MHVYSKLAAAALACLVSGCGTFVNTYWCYPCGGGNGLPEQFRVYGGIRNDVQMLREVKHSDPCTLAIAPLIVLDMPLSLVADTLTLPACLAVQLSKASDGNTDVGPRPQTLVVAE
jgi:uncharacterized protein YceK